MIHLLIDTCVWKQMVSKNEVSPSLVQINEWVKSGHVTLLYPEAVKSEWERHREKELASIIKAVEKQKKTLTLLTEGNETLLKTIDSQSAIDKLQTQVEIIDKLLNDSVFIPESENVIIISRKHQKNKKAPFINKINSSEDASIIFSSLEFIQTNNLVEFYFVSENINDFAINRNGTHEIHPDILDEFSGLNIIYFKEIKTLIETLINNGLPNKIEVAKEDSKSADFFLAPQVNKDDKIIDQLYTFLKERFSVFQTLPHYIWANKYPFKITPKAYFEYNLFCLYTDNAELFGFFKSLKISENKKVEFTDLHLVEGVENHIEKTLFILTCLNNNLVFNIELNGEQTRKEIRYFLYPDTNFPDNYLINLQFDKAWESLSNSLEDEESIEKTAFLNYEFGNYTKAARIYLKLLEKKEKSIVNNSKLFIYQYNLSKLEPFVKYQFSEEKPDLDLVKRLKKVRKEFESDSTIFYNDTKLTKWIKEGRFMIDRQEVILEDGGKLRDFYFMLQNGGRGSNSFIWTIYANHAMLLSFLNDNKIINEFGSEVAHINEIFTESIIISHSIHSSIYSRLEVFDDWIIKALILYCKPDSIIKYCNRYSLKSIKYSHNSLLEDGFMDLARNFFKSYESLIKNLELNPGYYFTDKFRRIFGNIITLASFLELSEEDDKEIASLLYTFFTKRQIFNFRNEVKFVNRFLIKKKIKFGTEILEQYFNLIYISPNFHDEDFLEAITICLQNENTGIQLTSDSLNIIFTFINDNCPICNRKHDSSILIPFYKIAENADAKESIQNKIFDLLNQKFDWRLYYLSVIYDIIKIDEVFFTQLINLQKPITSRPSFTGYYSKDELNRDFRLGAIINICFKHGIDLRNEKFSHLRGFDPYYDWLLDMENFDYHNFNPRWVSEYPTKYYFEKISKVELARKKISEYLQKVEDPLLTKHYLEITNLAETYNK